MRIKVRLFDEDGNVKKFPIHVGGDPETALEDTKKKIVKLFEGGES